MPRKDKCVFTVKIENTKARNQQAMFFCIIFNVAFYGPEIDWWSFAIMIYELFYYETPFYDDSQMMQQAAIINFEDKFNFPEDEEIKISTNAKSFIKSFIQKRTKRAGRNGPDDISDITDHKFFAGVDWNFDTIRNYDPPFPVELKNPKDTSNFDVEENKSNDLVDTSDFRNKNRNQEGVFQGKHLPFIGFSFNTIPENRTVQHSTTTVQIDNPELKNQIEKLKTELDSKISAMESLDVSLKNTRDDLFDKNKELAKNQDKLKSTVQELEKAKLSFTKKCDELETIKNDNEENKREKMKLDLEVKQLQQSFSSTKNQQTQEQQRIHTLEKQLLEVKLTMDSKYEEVKKLKQREDELLSDQYDKEAHIKKLVEDKMEMERTKEFLSREIKTTHSQLETQIRLNSELNDKVELKTEKIFELEKEKDMMDKSLEKEKIMKHQVVMKLGQVQSDFSSLQRKERDGFSGMLRRGFGNIRQSSENEKKVRNLEKQMKGLRSENARMKQESEAVRSKCENEIWSKNVEIDDLREKVKLLEQQIQTGENMISPGAPTPTPRRNFRAWLGIQSTAVSRKDEGENGDLGDSPRLVSRRGKVQLKFQTVYGEICREDKIFRLFVDDKRTRIVCHFKLDEVKRARAINDIDIHPFRHKEANNIQSIFQLVVLTEKADVIFFRANNQNEQKIWLENFNSLI